LVHCSSADSEENIRVKQAIHDVCQQSIGNYPGAQVLVLWKGKFIGDTKNPAPDFAYVQHRLRGVVFDGIIKNPDSFLNQVASFFLYSIMTSKLHDDLDQYLTNEAYFSSDIVTQNFSKFPEWQGSQNLINPKHGSKNAHNLRDTVRSTIWIPQALLLTTLGIILVGLLRFLINYFRIESNRPRFELYSISLLSLMYIVLIIFSISISSLVNFRYYFGVIPVCLILLAINIGDLHKTFQQKN
jgi:hypothetical protein